MAVYKPVRALERGLHILEVVNERDGVKTQEIADLTGLSRPTVFRLLETLQSMGFVAQSASGVGWHPTLACHLLSSGFVDKSWVGQIAMPEMIELGRKILWPIDLVTIDEGAMLIRETTHKVSPFSFDSGMVGKHVPLLHTAGGHAYIANCPDDEREVIFEMLRKSGKAEHALIHDPRVIAQIIARTRERGFGFRTEGYRNHTHSVASPILHEGRVLACLSVICLKSAISFDDMARKFAPRLKRTCDRISELIARQAGSQAPRRS
ncbi:helix-turn-helix domain-containing protein [Seohaeicola saemankumensis]|nr:helix-turn-helix domain-containing protein [Seohaeicola saemankumensis]MCA0869963.1 helix-turn-helix domain-containing protein [Seohaeicola saemankumensis]